MRSLDLHGHRLTGSTEAVTAYNAGVADLLRLRRGAINSIAASIVLDPTFALGHAALALLGHEFGASVDIPARLRAAQLHAPRSTERERSHIYAISSHLAGNSDPLIAHLADHPRDALLLSVAVPTIAFAGITRVPARAWAIVETAAPAYGADWWAQGLLAFIRQEQGRFDEAMDLACRSLRVEPGAGHSAHARAHAHYETGDHGAGLQWMDEWIGTDGREIDNLCHFSWHAALHELSQGDLGAVQRRYAAQLRPRPDFGCRNLVDAGSLLWRWQISPGVRATDVPPMSEVLAGSDPQTLSEPSTPFMAMHVAVALLAVADTAGLLALQRYARSHLEPTFREVLAPLAGALALLSSDRPGAAADALGALSRECWRLGGSDAQREVIEETRLHALLRAGRYDEARTLIDARLDRRHSPRDAAWLDLGQPEPASGCGTPWLSR